MRSLFLELRYWQHHSTYLDQVYSIPKESNASALHCVQITHYQSSFQNSQDSSSTQSVSVRAILDFPTKLTNDMEICRPKLKSSSSQCAPVTSNSVSSLTSIHFTQILTAAQTLVNTMSASRGSAAPTPAAAARQTRSLSIGIVGAGHARKGRTRETGVRGGKRRLKRRGGHDERQTLAEQPHDEGHSCGGERYEATLLLWS